jgi:hypothetical protein
VSIEALLQTLLTLAEKEWLNPQDDFPPLPERKKKLHRGQELFKKMAEARSAKTQMDAWMGKGRWPSPQSPPSPPTDGTL